MQHSILIMMLLFTLNVQSALKHFNGELLSFVSFSMPDLALKNWIEDANHYHIPVFIRGFVHDSFKETISHFKTLDTHGGLQIDPKSFRKFNIQAVPALVANIAGNEQQQFKVLYGNIKLHDLLENLCEEHIHIACEKIYSHSPKQDNE